MEHTPLGFEYVVTVGLPLHPAAEKISVITVPFASTVYLKVLIQTPDL